MYPCLHINKHALGTNQIYQRTLYWKAKAMLLCLTNKLKQRTFAMEWKAAETCWSGWHTFSWALTTSSIASTRLHRASPDNAAVWMGSSPVGITISPHTCVVHLPHELGSSHRVCIDFEAWWTFPNPSHNGLRSTLSHSCIHMSRGGEQLMADSSF